MAEQTTVVAEPEPPPPDAWPPAGDRVDRSRLATLSAGHTVTDSYGSSLLSPLFPVLAERLSLTLAQVGGLPVMMGLSASLCQPVIGLITDRWPRIPAVALGPALAALFIGLVGFAPNYAALALLLFLSGLGIGAFHPQGAALASRAARGRGLPMSLFTVGGNIGFGLAPLLGAGYFLLFGLERFYLAAIPGLLAGFLLYRVLRRNGGELLSRPAELARAAVAKGDPASLALLTGTVALRSAVQIALVIFIPFLLLQRFPESGPALAGAAASIFLLANAVSGPIGGFLCDRYGRRRVMLVSLLLPPLLFKFGLGLPGYWLIAGLALGGFVLMLPHPANVVMAQEYMPGSVGVGASMITGLAWGLGQFLAWPVGALAERTSLEFALQLVIWLPLLGAALVLPLRDPRERDRRLPRTPSGQARATRTESEDLK